MQVVGIMPCLLTAWGVAHGHRVLAFWRFLDGSQSTITACKHGLSARAPNFTAFHGFSRLFRILSDPGMEGGVLDPAQTYQIFDSLDLHLAEAEAESQVHLISPELPLPGLASVML